MKTTPTILALALVISSALYAADPLLPTGLDVSFESSASHTATKKQWKETLPFPLSGFWETRLGTRLQDDPYEESLSIAESRLHLETDTFVWGADVAAAVDILIDPYFPESIHLDKGTGAVDIRTLSAFFTPASFLDMKVGRQTLTWGTGDLVFINDMFPKDWNSFFLGRDQDYLKAPSDALKASLYMNTVNLDLVYTPEFDADRFIDGTRISFYSPSVGDIVGQNAALSVDEHNLAFQDDEIALRAYRLFGSLELAGYYYNGYWKSPSSQNNNGQLYFSSLAVYGASVITPFQKGVLSLELGKYDSQEDRSGTNPSVPNSETRVLVGYEQELQTNLTGSIQYYVEIMDHHGTYLNTLPDGATPKDEYRHVLTTRFTKLLKNQTWILSAFNFYSPSDKDGYLRLNVTYKWSDAIRLETGSHYFYGQNDTSFFGQFRQNNSLYAAVRVGV